MTLQITPLRARELANIAQAQQAEIQRTEIDWRDAARDFLRACFNQHSNAIIRYRAAILMAAIARRDAETLP